MCKASAIGEKKTKHRFQDLDVLWLPGTGIQADFFIFGR
jgi:hypothetical protein